MIAPALPLFCCRYDKPIAGEAILVPVFSASGVRPDQHRHGDGECPADVPVPRRADGRFIGRGGLPPGAP